MQRNLKLLVVMLVVAIQPASADCLRQLATSNQECDTLVLTNGKSIAVKNLQRTATEFLFTYCQDSANQVHRAPIAQVRTIKNAKGEVHFLTLKDKPQPLSESPLQKQEKQIRRLYRLSLLGIFPFPIYTQVILIVVAFSMKKKLKNNPHKIQLNQKLNRLIVLNCISLLLVLALGLLFIWTLAGMPWGG